MKRLLLLFMVVLGTTVVTKLSANKPKEPVKASSHKSKAKFTNFTASLSRGSNVSGTWVISFSGTPGTFNFPFNSGSSTVTVPTGTYQVGIHPAGGGSSSYTISGRVCTNNYDTVGTSALFNNVPCTCGSGSFSIN